MRNRKHRSFLILCFLLMSILTDLSFAPYSCAEEMDQESNRIGEAEALFEQGKYLEAAEVYFSLDALSDAYEILIKDIDYPGARDLLYQIAVKASAKKDYELSVQAFTAINPYKDTLMRLTMDTYQLGKVYLDQGENEKAADIFAQMGDFSDAESLRDLANYRKAAQLKADGKYNEAAEAFESMGDYEDSASQAVEASYYAAKALLNQGEYSQAKNVFTKIGDYSDSKEMIRECDYLLARIHYDAEEWEKAYQLMNGQNLVGYKDVSEILNECSLQLGKDALENLEFDTALQWFGRIPEYKNAKDLALECRYQIALKNEQDGKTADAIIQFGAIENYRDSKTQIEKCNYALAAEAETDEDLQAAYDYYILAGDYNDAKMKAEGIACTIGQKELYAGNYTTALSWLGKAPNSAEAQSMILSIGDYYFLTSQYSEAEQVYVSVLDRAEAKQRLYEIAEAQSSLGMNEDALRLFSMLGDYSDAGERTIEIQWDLISAFATKHQYSEALSLLEEIEGGTQTEAYLIFNILSKDVGSTVSYGLYPMTRKKEYQPLTWTIVAEGENGKLLLCNFNVDNQKFNEKWANVTWNECSLRTWLNTTFMETAFTQNQQKYIREVLLDDSEPSDTAADKIFILSKDEWENCPAYVRDKGTMNTEYAVLRGVYNNKSGRGWSWLRSNGVDLDHAQEIDCTGKVNEIGSFVDCKNTGIRPAFWLNYPESGR